MSRDFLQQTPAEPAPAVTSAPQAPVASGQKPAPEQEQLRDLLAGAFPAWDLLPAVPFVRRVK